MPKYLVQSCYTSDGLKGVLKEGGTKRREAIEQAAKSMGGTAEAVYFAFGDVDVFVILDLPDNVSAIAGSLIVNAAGTSKTTYTVLISPEEFDQAVNMAGKFVADYRPPGQ